MQQLKISCKAYGDVDSIKSNIHSALARGLPALDKQLSPHDGTWVIVGSGPSLPDYEDQIREHVGKHPICSVNGAHDFMVSKGMNPDYFLSVDPRDTIVANTSKKNDHTNYLLASRCCPELFDHLADKKVTLWHSWSPDTETEAFHGHMAIGGGSTSGLRAIHVGYVLGYRKFIVYGLDSCLAEDGKTKRFSGEKAGRVIDVHVGNKVFLTNEAMAQQASECQMIPEVLKDATIDFKGPGLLATIWEERRKLGYPT